MLLVSADGVPDVPTEARAFLGVVAAVAVFLFVVFLYWNKKQCFSTIGSLPCCDEPKQKRASKDLGLAYNYDERGSSSDSEEDPYKRLTSSKGYQKAEREQQLYQSQSSHQSCQSCHHNYHQLEQPRPSSRYSNKNEIARLEKLEKSPKPAVNNDLMSLAEKGRVGIDEITGNAVASSSSSSSSGSSTTSGDDELLTRRTLRHRDPNRAYRHLSPVRSPYHINLQQQDFNGISEEALLIKCGSLEVGFCYDLPTKTLTVHVLQAKDVPSKEKGGTANSQVRLHVLPGRKQRQKTKVRTGENPQFNEAFVFNKINPEDVQQLGIRLRLCGSERMRRERIIGEVIVPLSTVSIGMGNTTWLTLEPRAITTLQHLEERAEIASLTRSDSTGSNHSVHSGLPELLLGLAYNGTTGRLAVEIIKGSHFRNMDDYRNLNISRAPDSYVKLSLTSSSGQEIASSKSSVRRGQPNPLYKETFMFQVALFQLHDVTLMITVYAKRSIKKKDPLGWFSLGLNSSGEEELTHWNAMRDSKGEQISRWHVLLDS